LEGHSLIATFYDVTFVAPTVHEGNFYWEGEQEDAEEAFEEYLASNFPEDSYKILSFKIADNQQMELPLDYKKSLH
jgi:hypothetical protein